MNHTSEFLDYAGLQRYDQRIKRSIKISGYQVDENGVLGLVSFTAGIKLITADGYVLSASNSIRITTEEE